MNWRTLLGLILIFGAISEMISIVVDYNSGKLGFWPFGADVACLVLIITGCILIKKGRQQRQALER
jgi:hypothetical protein